MSVDTDRELLREAREVLQELAFNPAYAGDAPEFNEGGIGYEMCRKIQEQLEDHQ
jgi:hypothetical protein